MDQCVRVLFYEITYSHPPLNTAILCLLSCYTLKFYIPLPLHHRGKTAAAARPGLYRGKQSNAPGKVRQEMPALEENDGKKGGRRGGGGEEEEGKEMELRQAEKKEEVVGCSRARHVRTH